MNIYYNKCLDLDQKINDLGLDDLNLNEKLNDLNHHIKKARLQKKYQIVLQFLKNEYNNSISN